MLQRNIPREQLGRVFGARSTLLTGGSPLGLAMGDMLLAFVPSTSVIALSAIACILVGLGALHRRHSETCRFHMQPPMFKSKSG